MVPVIDKQKTGNQIRKYMNLRGLSVQDVKTYLSLGCVQSVYHWLDGQSAPSLDNLYALSELLRVPMDGYGGGEDGRRFLRASVFDPWGRLKSGIGFVSLNYCQRV